VRRDGVGRVYPPTPFSRTAVNFMLEDSSTSPVALARSLSREGLTITYVLQGT
jgi:hypothetical protein